MSRAALLAAAAIVLLLGGAAAGYALRGGEPKPAVRTALAESNHPRGAKGRDLGLAKVVVPSGTKLALHRHVGTQIAHIARGTLTYSVREGGVRIHSGQPGDGAEVVGRIDAGETGSIRRGQWIIEQPQTIHHAANRGKGKVVIYVATLFRDGAPPSVPVTP